MLEAINGPTTGPTNLSVTTTAVEAKVGGSALSDRKAILVQTLGGDIYWGFDNTVTTSTGIKLHKLGMHHLPYSSDISIWLISDSGGGYDTRIAEVA